MDFPLNVVGLTGGIASGKSVAARVMRTSGIPVIDADELGHMVLDPGGAAYEAVLDEFGSSILGLDGRTIDRQALGREVFDNPDRRRTLEALTHPAIARLAKTGMELVAARGEKLVIYEAALLVETGIYRSLAGLVVVSTSLENQISRLVHRDGLNAPAAAARIASQLPLEAKLAVADWVLENNGTHAEFCDRTAALAAVLKTRFA